MKRFLLVAAFIACALFVAGPANATVLDSSYLIGTVVDGIPSGAEQELLYVNSLITAYNNNTAAGIIFDAGPPLVNETFTTTTLVTDFGLLPSPAVFGTKDDSAPFFNIDLSTTPYTYLYAKYGAAGGDQFGALYFIAGLTSIENINPNQGLSHVSLYNPTQVPEGATLMLLGFGLAGVGTLRRFMKL
jgi:hypothetical protein